MRMTTALSTAQVFHRTVQHPGDYANLDSPLCCEDQAPLPYPGTIHSQPGHRLAVITAGTIHSLPGAQTQVGCYYCRHHPQPAKCTDTGWLLLLKAEVVPSGFQQTCGQRDTPTLPPTGLEAPHREAPHILTGRPLILTGRPLILTWRPHILTGRRRPHILTGRPLILTGRHHILTGRPHILTGRPHILTGRPHILTGRPHSAPLIEPSEVTPQSPLRPHPTDPPEVTPQSPLRHHTTEPPEVTPQSPLRPHPTEPHEVTPQSPLRPQPTEPPKASPHRAP
ncbi:hypothetical protein ACOMHN_033960 [Nucella lapillus]